MKDHFIFYVKKNSSFGGILVWYSRRSTSAVNALDHQWDPSHLLHVGINLVSSEGPDGFLKILKF